MSETQRKLSGILRKFADNLDAGNTPFDESEMEYLLDAVNFVSTEKMSKYQAAQYLNINIKQFDYLVATGKLPKGRKQAGFKEKFWYKKDLNYPPKHK